MCKLHPHKWLTLFEQAPGPFLSSHIHTRLTWGHSISPTLRAPAPQGSFPKFIDSSFLHSTNPSCASHWNSEAKGIQALLPRTSSPPMTDRQTDSNGSKKQDQGPTEGTDGNCPTLLVLGVSLALSGVTRMWRPEAWRKNGTALRRPGTCSQWVWLAEVAHPMALESSPMGASTEGSSSQTSLPQGGLSPKESHAAESSPAGSPIPASSPSSPPQCCLPRQAPSQVGSPPGKQRGESFTETPAAGRFVRI